MSRMDRLSGRRGDMTSSGRHGVKEKAWRERKTLEPEQIQNFRGEETRVRGTTKATDEGE